MMRYCPYCCQNVNSIAGFHWGPLILGLLFGLVPGILYWYFKRQDICPLCRCPEKDLLPPKSIPRIDDDY